MAESLKDLNVTWNVGGVLTHASSVEEGGGASRRYDTTAVGGPPSADISPTVRDFLSYSIRTKVMGADQAAREAFLAKFAAGQIFDAVSGTPTGNGQMKITGANTTRAAGRRFVVMNSNASTAMGENTELSVTIEEIGATPA
jgi:hypothetical protein